MKTIGWVRDGKYIGTRQLRENLSKVMKSQHAFFVTEHGRPVKAMISFKVLMDLLELLEELKDKTLIRQIIQGRKEYEAGGWISINRLKKSLGY